MKETVLDVLMYLFENYFEDEVVLGANQEHLKNDLVSEGFTERTVDKALSWLEGLAPGEDGAAPMVDTGPTALRHYTRREEERLDAEARGFLLFLEQVALLDATRRELVIDQVMGLDSDDVDLDQVKWVVQMVLFNHPVDEDQDKAWLENLVFADDSGQLH
ncbi:MAG: DUF494 domain-containing protein [Gammaproteobacteria bacterium]|nr:DUF494 domain-containing protein [Gammaproteobacteria bacterium]